MPTFDVTVHLGRDHVVKMTVVAPNAKAARERAKEHALNYMPARAERVSNAKPVRRKK